MSFDISKELKQTFELVTLRREAMKGFSAKDWNSFQKVTDRFDQKRRFESRSYKLEYESRVEDATQALIDKAGSLKRDFKHRIFGRDVFNKSENNRQAERQVRFGHAQLISGLQKQELLEKRSLMNRVIPHRELKHKAKKQFERVTDRRDGSQRRGRSIGPSPN